MRGLPGALRHECANLIQVPDGFLPALDIEVEELSAIRLVDADIDGFRRCDHEAGTLLLATPQVFALTVVHVAAILECLYEVGVVIVAVGAQDKAFVAKALHIAAVAREDDKGLFRRLEALDVGKLLLPHGLLRRGSSPSCRRRASRGP